MISWRNSPRISSSGSTPGGNLRRTQRETQEEATKSRNHQLVEAQGVSALNATAGMSSVAPDQNPPSDPPSLRRRAPARIDVTLKAGLCVPITPRNVHLRAGR